MTIRFSDGLEIDETGDYRVISEFDGLYVVGNGLLCAVNTREEGETLIRQLQSPSVNPPNQH